MDIEIGNILSLVFSHFTKYKTSFHVIFDEKSIEFCIPSLKVDKHNCLNLHMYTIHLESKITRTDYSDNNREKKTIDGQFPFLLSCVQFWRLSWYCTIFTAVQSELWIKLDKEWVSVTDSRYLNLDSQN